MRQVLIINRKIEEAEEIAHNLGETKAEITCVSSIHEALCQFIQKEFSLVTGLYSAKANLRRSDQR